MPILSNKSLPRRTFLQGMGAAVALPYLDAMEPAVREQRLDRMLTDIRRER